MWLLFNKTARENINKNPQARVHRFGLATAAARVGSRKFGELSSEPYHD